MRFLVRVLSSTLAILLITRLMRGVSIDGPITAVLVAVVLSVLNIYIKPLLILFTLPITFVTLGFFLLVINAAIILMASSLVPGFHVDGFWWAMLFSVILSIVTSVFEGLSRKNNEPEN